MFRLRRGELDIQERMGFTADSTQWREINIYKR